MCVSAHLKLCLREGFLFFFFFLELFLFIITVIPPPGPNLVYSNRGCRLPRNSFYIAIVLLRDLNLYTLSLTYAYVCLYFLDVQNNNKSDACNRTISTTTHLSASSNILTKSGPIELKLCTRPIVYILMTMGVFFWCKVIRNLKICKWPLSHKSHA